MNELNNILEKLRELKPELENEYFVQEIGIFGSYVRNEQTLDSDIDLLIQFREGMDLFKLAHLIKWLGEIFGKKVDIANKKTLRPRIGKKILSEVIYV